MPLLRPFNTTGYNTNLINDLNLVVAPPYDVITPEQREIYASKSPYNIVHLTLPEGEGDNKYSNAKKKLLSWLLKDVLTTDKNPGIFIYEQKFTIRGANYKRRGIVSLLKVEEYGNGVFRHEKTFGGPKEDRRKLMEAVEGQLEPLFFLYSDRDNLVNSKIYDMEFDYTAKTAVDENGVKHTLWKIPNKQLEDFILETLSKSSIYIADGHHRYETTLQYVKEKGGGDNDTYSYVLGTFFNMYSRDLVILPTHRLVKVDSFSQEEFIKKLDRYFKIAVINYSEQVVDVALNKLNMVMSDRKQKGSVCFGLYSMYEATKLYLITLKDEVKSSIIQEYSKNLGKEVASLDVSILTELVLKDTLGLSDEQILSRAYVDYIRYEKEGLQTVKKGIRDLLFILNPVTVDEVIKVSEAGLVMPQKSTDFYPKIESGLSLYLFREQQF
ncbi:MAG: DUF1015 domain-containing protein [Spirochaetia bacterium]|nr:DUF1015 domain-containing protein [Spirochaetota bacterium]MCX8096560.1 DUF1015 domain-containing protein [Spirochaetota bacterium]MDW8112886.1 DUF1015 domain-containing protein [Spirochaetia bacterium]